MTRKVLRPLLYILISMVLGGAGLAIAWHHPLSGVWASSLFVFLFAIGLARKPYWLILIPALLPVIDLAPWSGWMSFEEFDLLVLSLASGAYLRAVLENGAQPERRSRLSLLGVLLIACFAVSVLISLDRGVADAGHFEFGWYQGYYEPMNSVRLAKSFFLALFLLPLWHGVYRRESSLAISFLGSGMVAGLGLAALATIWERSAFTGLLNFSSDYRTTGLFWEMHVGGAALDGFLALTVPFAVREIMLAESRRRMLIVGGVLVLAAYACLTTFSRGVYAAVPVGVGLTAWLAMRTRHINIDALRGRRELLVGGGVLLFFAVAAFAVFQGSGYRGMLALFLACGLFYPVGLSLARTSKAVWWSGLAIGLVFSIVALLIGVLLPKGAYLDVAATMSLTVAGVRLQSRGNSIWAPALALAGYLSMLSSSCLVAWYWAGSDAAIDMLTICVMLLGGMLAVRHWPLPVCNVRWQLGISGALLLIAAIVAIFSGGRYMSERFSTSDRDLGNRFQHWEAGLAQLNSWDWWLGKGLGRFPATYFFAVPNAEYPGRFRLQEGGGGNAYLQLVGGRHVNGWGQIFRITQRVWPGHGGYKVKFDVRAENDVQLHFEVCDKHLIYNADCVASQITVKGNKGVWQTMEAPLNGSAPTGGPWYAPRLVAFSIATESRGGVAELDNVALYTDDGQNILANGDFSNGLARWFSSSDKHHMPWHVKNLFLHVLFEQGWLGLAVLSAMLVGALLRLLTGKAARNSLADAALGGLVAFLIVGLFDSLLDVPRVAALFFWLLLICLTGKSTIPGRRAARTAHGQPESRRSVASVVASLLVLLMFCSEGREASAGERVMAVGPQREVRTLADAARLAKSGDMIEVDAGEYSRDVAVWTQDNLTLRAVGGRVRLRADGAAAEAKAIWVIRGGRIVVEGFDFVGASVPDRNGAGIRFERGQLVIRDCGFFHNENGILTGSDATSTLDVEKSEFGFNGYGDGRSHNLYVGQIARLSVTTSYFHHANAGHLLKSRAMENLILANKLTDENDGHASYELEFPNGGMTWVVANLIAQGPGTENSTIISFGAEGLRAGDNQLFLSHNTVVNHRPNGAIFIKAVQKADIWAENNIFAGRGTFDVQRPGWDEHNFHAGWGDFVDAARGDYRLRAKSDLRGKAVKSLYPNPWLRPCREYVHPRSAKELDNLPVNPGAFQS